MHPVEHPTNKLLSGHGIYEVQENVQFRTQVAKFSRRPLTLSKKILIAVESEQPEMTISNDEQGVSSNTEVNAAYYKELENFGT